MNLTRVVVTGIGIVCPSGNWPGQVFDNVAAGRSAIRLLPASARQSPVLLAAFVDEAVSQESAGSDRVAQLSLAAGRRALENAGLLERPDLLTDMAIHLGTGSGGNATQDAAFHRLYAENKDRIAPMSLPRGMMSAAASEMSIKFGIRGQNNTYAVACASSSAAIGEALRTIRHGYADRVLAGGSEALLTYGVLHAWHALCALAPADQDVAASCRPFSKDRNGLVLGEGAAFLVLESLDSALSRKATILAELVGFGSSCDASHITHPSVDGQVRAMHLALKDAGISAGAVDYINAHGTATVVGDAIEAESIRTVFGHRNEAVPVSSTKAVHGHLMGAGGAVELALSLLAMEHGLIPPTANCRELDESLGIDVVTSARHKNIDCVMSNSFAFGGSNNVLIAKKYQAT